MKSSYKLALCILISACAAWAQSTAAGTVNGQVTDPQNAVIAGADVKVVDVGTRGELSATTNDDLGRRDESGDHRWRRAPGD